MSRSNQIYLQDIFEIIDQYINNKTDFEFAKDMMLQDAIIRRFEIIGEAASKISDKLKTENPGIAWRLMKEMRNKLIHDYFGISPLTIYTTIKMDLPILKEQIAKLL